MGDRTYNYKISLDNGNAEMYCITNADYQQAYELFSKWFKEERYSGEYKNLEEFMLQKGYLIREQGLTNSNATLINFDDISFE